jgi:dimethylamine/trimethylamine dehydrogenase
MEQTRIQAGQLEAGVDERVSRALARADAGVAVSACVFTGREEEHPCDALVLVTARLPDDALALELEATGVLSVRAIGDAAAPGTIAAAVWDGRRYAEELDAPPGDDTLPPFRREVVALSAE